MSARPPEWQLHENHVAALYKRLGFSVDQNLSVDGQQVDLVCEKWVTGIGCTRLCVDCKHTALTENRSVSKDDVDHFYFTFKNRADANRWTAAIMVSNRPFSQFAKAAAARHPNLHLKTLDDLHEEVLNIKWYLHNAVGTYEGENRFYDFIPPYGSRSAISESTRTNETLLQALVEDWLKHYDAQQLCLFGDFGTGKTTFLEHIHYTLAKRYLSDASCRIPLLIPLRKYYEAADYQEIIRSFFALDLVTAVQQNLFDKFLEEGRLLLLLDGFDEMGARSDPTTRKANYLKLAPFAEKASKVIISCRPSYFLSLEETQSVFSFVKRQVGFAPLVKPSAVSEKLFQSVQDADLNPIFSKVKTALGGTEYVYISLFDIKQIRAYLKKHNDEIKVASGGGLDATGLLARIKDIYDLEDLAQRPILLRLIVKTLPLFRRSSDGGYELELEGSVQKVPDITPSVLYAVYTEKELEREYKKGKIRWLIDRQVKVRVIASIAYEIFRRDEASLDKVTLAQVVERAFPGSDADQAAYLTDIRTCSFLHRDNQDCVRFTHKSFMEYYAATYIRLSMTGSEAVQNTLSARRLSDIVAFFLGDSIAVGATESTYESLMTVYNHLMGVAKPSETCLENIVNVLNYARKPISPLTKSKFGQLVYLKLSISSQLWVGVVIGTLKIIRLNAGSLRFDGAEVKQLEANSVTAKHVACTNSDLRGLRFWGVTLERFDATESVVSFETWRHSRITKGVFKRVVFADSGSSAQWTPAEAEFEDCIFAGVDLRSLRSGTVSFVRCTFIMCEVDLSSWRASRADNCHGVLISPTGQEMTAYAAKLFICGELSQNTSRSTSAPRRWEDLFVAAFGRDARRLPKSEAEIRNRLRQVDTAWELTKRKGQQVVVSGSEFSNGDNCRIIDADLQNVSFMNLVTRATFTERLRRLTPEREDWTRLMVS